MITKEAMQGVSAKKRAIQSSGLWDHDRIDLWICWCRWWNDDVAHL